MPYRPNPIWAIREALLRLTTVEIPLSRPMEARNIQWETEFFWYQYLKREAALYLFIYFIACSWAIKLLNASEPPE